MVVHTFFPPPPQTSGMIIGPGAMGLLILWDLCSPSSTEKAILIGKSPVRYPIGLKSPNLVVDPLTPENSFFYHDISQTTAARTRRIFVAVPPDQVNNVVDSLTKLTLPENFTIIFCNNGMVSSETLIKLLEQHPGAMVARALLHVGARREVTETQTLIVHTGGQRATWGWMHGANPETLTGKIIHWEYRNDILKLEAEKLFINLILAEVIGSNSTPNGELWNLITRSKALRAAETFSEIFSDRTLDPKSLVESLSQTVCDTAQNINSISAALARYDSGPRDSLAQNLRDHSPNKSLAKEFFGLLKE